MKKILALLLVCAVLCSCESGTPDNETTTSTDTSTTSVSSENLTDGISETDSTTTPDIDLTETEITDPPVKYDNYIVGLDGYTIGTDDLKDGKLCLDDTVFVRRASKYNGESKTNWKKTGDIIELASESGGSYNLTFIEAKSVYIEDATAIDGYIYADGDEKWVEGSAKLSGSIIFKGTLSSDESGNLYIADDGSNFISLAVSPIEENDTLVFSLGNIADYPETNFDILKGSDGKISIGAEIAITDISLFYSAYDGKVVTENTAKIQAIEKLSLGIDIDAIENLCGVWESNNGNTICIGDDGTNNSEFFSDYPKITDLYEYNGKTYVFKRSDVGEYYEYVFDKENPDEFICYTYFSSTYASREAYGKTVYKRTGEAEPYSMVGNLGQYSRFYLNNIDNYEGILSDKIERNGLTYGTNYYSSARNYFTDTIDVFESNRIVITRGFTVSEGDSDNLLSCEAVKVTYTLTRSADGKWSITEWYEHNPIKDTVKIENAVIEPLLKNLYGAWRNGKAYDFFLGIRQEQFYCGLLESPVVHGLYEDYRAYYLYIGEKDSDLCYYIIMYKDDTKHIFICPGTVADGQFTRTGYYCRLNK